MLFRSEPFNPPELITLGQFARRVLRLSRAGATWGLAQLVNSKRLKRRAAGLALRGLGVRVCIDRRDHQPSGRCEVHVLNGNNLLDGLVQRSGFANPEHLCCLAHPSPLEPLSALQLKAAVRLAGQRRALVIPWLLQSPNQPIREIALLNHPRRQLWARLTGPEILLECQEGEPIDAGLLAAKSAEQQLKKFYLKALGPVGTVSDLPKSHWPSAA